MKTVKPFVDLGFYVVPLAGEIRRTKEGKKTGYKFVGAWKELYLENPYEVETDKEAAKIGAMICGKRSGAVSIDCDDQETYEIFKELDPSYDFVFVSAGKKTGGASIIYRMPADWQSLSDFRIHNDSFQLDFISNDNLQFLPTDANRTKVTWTAETLKELPKLREPPKSIINLITNFSELHRKTTSAYNEEGRITQGTVESHYRFLAPFIQSFIKTDKFSNELFRILTPKKGGFRELPQYVDTATLHPDNIPEGMGNAYLSSVAGVLVNDESVSPALFKEFMHKINNMWSRPKPAEEIEALVKYELGRDKWKYNKDWKEKINVVLTEYGTMITVFYDPLTRIYYALDDKLGMSTFDNIDALPRHLNSVVLGDRRYKTSEIYSYLDQKKTVFTPLESFGELPPEQGSPLKRHNMFCRPKTYDILLNPEKFRLEYQKRVPETTIAFFEHLIPDIVTRDYVLRFVLTKLKTLWFSEVILYFLGMTGAGKNLFVDWLAKFTENTAELTKNDDFRMVIEVDLENFLSKYNLWIINALFANLDEYGEKTRSSQEDKQVLAQLKSYTGKEIIQLRSMHRNPTSAYHRCTFILTANENKLSPDLEDRRLVLIETPEKLADAEFVKNFASKSDAIQQLFAEQDAWAYYWATTYKQLSMDEYRTPPQSEFKRRLILKHLPPSKYIAALIKNNDVENLVNLFDSNGLLQELLEEGKFGVISKSLLINVFDVMTDGTGARKAMLDNSLRDFNLVPSKIRMKSKVTYGFHIIGLAKWANGVIMSESGDLLAEEDDE